MSTKSLLQRIREIEKLTKSETKVAVYLENKYPNLSFETITTISQGAGVGNATVGRFVIRLGYENFADFISQIRDEISTQIESPIDRYKLRRDTLSESESVMERHFKNATINIMETSSRISDDEIEKAAGLLTGSKGKLYITGGATAHSLASYFYLFSKYIREDVVLLNPDVSRLAHHLIDVNSDDVLVAISHKRYSSPVIKMAEWFRKTKAKVVGITDRETSPLARLSDIRFIVRTEGTAMFNSRVVTLLLLETLVEAMVLKCEDKVSERFKVFEELVEEFDVYTSTF